MQTGECTKPLVLELRLPGQAPVELWSLTAWLIMDRAYGLACPLGPQLCACARIMCCVAQDVTNTQF